MELFEFLEKGIIKIGLFLSGQEVLQIKPNLVWSIPKLGRLWDKKGRLFFLEKSSFFNGKHRLIRLLFA